MKPTRIFATATLVISSFCLITAASISVGDEPGVVRMTPQSASGRPAPTPDSIGVGVARVTGSPSMQEPAPAPASAPVPEQAPPVMEQGVYPQPGEYAPYFERSYSATEAMPPVYFQPAQPFGPILMFESNIGDGLGYNSSYQRLNSRIPYHIVPDTTVLMLDANASVTNFGNPLGNLGLIYRNYDESRNRIFGYNGYFDYDQGLTDRDWYRAGAGLESLGEFLDFRMNGYFVVGDNTALLSTQQVGGLVLAGNGIFRNRENIRENVYSGLDAETGGPLPFLGRYGINGYGGMYYLDNSHGEGTVGGQARVEALVSQNVTVNTNFTHDDHFGTSTWVGIQFEIPNYGRQRTFRPVSVRERLSDPTYRSNRVHSSIDTEIVREACINDVTGVAYNVVYVDPNSTTSTNVGTIENPFTSMSSLVNNAAIDIISVRANEDGSGTDLTVTGGLNLFDNQALVSRNSDYEVFRIGTTPFVIPGAGTAGLRPLLSDPNMLAGNSVINLANNNTVSGFQIDASNAANTVFGNGISNALPINGVNVQNNIFTDYVVGADLQDVSGRAIISGNTFTGRPVTAAVRSTYGLNMSVAGNQTMDLLLTGNTATQNQVAGLSVTAKTNSTLNADDLDGNTAFVPPAGKYSFDAEITGITENTLTGNGNGIEVLGQTGSTINAAIEDNTTNARLPDGTINTDALNGIYAEADGGTFNLFSLRNNTTTGQYDSNSAVAPVTNENGVVLYYTNGGTFFAASEDINEDVNFNGILDAGEDLDADGVLDVAIGALDAGEDLNGNGILDQGIVSNIFQNNTGVGLCIVGDGSGTGDFMIGGPATALGNISRNNGNAGVAADLTGTATASIDSMFNQITDNAFSRIYSTRVQASFATTGNTFNSLAVLTNQSAAADITQFSWNLDLPAGTQDWEFDTTVFNSIFVPDPGFPFTPAGGSDVVTGLTSVNGVAVPNGGPYAAIQPILDGGQSLQLGFLNDPTGNGGFDSNESFAWQLDSDPNNFLPDTGVDDAITANQLAGTSGSITFRDDFTGNGVQSLRTIAGTFAQSTTDPQGLVLNVDQTFTAPIFDTRSGIRGDGFRVQTADNSRLTSFRSINDTISRNKGDAISVVASDNSQVNALTIQGATLEQNQGRGINLEARDAAVITANSTIGGFDPRTLGRNTIGGTFYSEGNVIRGNSSDGVRVLASGTGVVNGNLINNTIENNLGDGAALIIDNGGTLNFGDLASNEVISRNTINNNNGAGIRLVSNVTPATVGELNAVIQGNAITSNAGGGIVSDINGLHAAPPANNTLNLTVNDAAYLDRTAEQNRNFIVGNGDVGIGVNLSGNGVANVNLNNVSVTGTFDGADPNRDGDGIALTRADASLLTATLNSVDVTGNAGDGLDVNAQGSDKNNPDQPNAGTPNTVTVTDSNFSNNGGNGAQFISRGAATLIGDVSQSTFSDNGVNGIRVETTENASFGDPTIGLPPGRRSQFDGNSITGNAVDGVQITASENSRALVEITSNLAPVVPSPHAAANTLGSTSISNNGRDGVRITTTGGASDVLITAGTASTLIDGNGTNGGGNGVRWDASGTSNGIVRVTRTTISNSIAGAAEVGDANNNGDVDVADGDGIQANFSQSATATLVVGNAGEGNVIQSNEDDGIAITADNSGDLAPVSTRPIISIVDNIIGGTNNGVAAGNGGDGVHLNLFGRTAVGLDPASINTDLASGPLSFNGGVTATGSIPQLTMTGNTITNNARRGVNILMNGAGGIRNREGGASTFNPILLTIDNNIISSNGTEGIFVRADADMNQSRFVYLANFPFPDPPFNPANDRPKFPFFYDPLLPQFTSLNVGSVNGNTAYVDPYLNLRTVQNSFLTVTNNFIQNNGVGTVTGEGLYINVGTGAYLAADVQNNTFGGNLEEDFRTESFLSFGETFTSVDDNGDQTFDAIYLDDTAQLDLRFQNNSGNQILASDAGATYTTSDPLKAIFLGAFGAANRDASLFQVDNGPNLNNPNNTFINFGITQDIQNSFTTGNYNLRGAADPLFPNIGFAPFLP
ncbi:MAG: inverse autotransporter beta domain-containing protein [Planctomycetota bacterium]